MKKEVIVNGFEKIISKTNRFYEIDFIDGTVENFEIEQELTHDYYENFYYTNRDIDYYLWNGCTQIHDEKNNKHYITNNIKSIKLLSETKIEELIKYEVTITTEKRRFKPNRIDRKLKLISIRKI